MALLLDTTLSGELANSYCDIAFADDYWANHYSATKAALWDALEDGQKQQLLIQACRVIESARFVETTDFPYSDSELHYDRITGTVKYYNHSHKPYKFSIIQNLQFPRNLDSLSDGTYIIPPEIKMAQCEQALYILALDETTLNNRIMGIKTDHVKVGDISLTTGYADNGGTASQYTLFSPVALEMIKPYLLKSGMKLRRS